MTDGPGRLTLLLTSPRVPAGVLTRAAWLALEAAAVVLGHPDEPQLEALRAAGMPVTSPPAAEAAPPLLARALVSRALADGPVVWVGSSDGDPGLTDAIAAEVTRLPAPPEVEVVVGSYDVQGARLLDLVAVMDRLRSPGGCPWDAEQTHASLVPYLIEETHEAVEAIESGDRAHMVEELGDVLLQVVFHARVAQEPQQHGRDPFDIDDIAAGIVAKLVRRHPHVFGGAEALEGMDAAAVEASWEAIKDAEKAGQPLDLGLDPGVAGAGGSGPAPGVAEVLRGIPAAMPTLARATKVVSRLRRRGLGDVVLEASASTDPGPRLLALVAEIEASGADPDAALRAVVRGLAGPGSGVEGAPGP